MRFRPFFILAILLGAAACGVDGGAERAGSGDVADVVRRHEAKARRVIDALDLDRPELAAVRAAADDGDLAGAWRALLAHYRDGDTAAWLRTPAPSGSRAADRVMRGVFLFHAVETPIPRRDDGGVDWTARPEGADDEATHELNRHEMLVQLLSGYRQAGNPRYAERIDSLVVDWVLANPYRGPGHATVPWRPLNVSARSTRWARVFFGLQDAEAFSTEARVLMLAGILDHADLLRKESDPRGNRRIGELYALATIAVAWPEFENSREWLSHATDGIVELAEGEVYPDGAEKELTSHYHRIALQRFDGFVELLRNAGRPVPLVLERTVEAMWSYLARVMCPDGHSPMNNDSDRDPTRDRVAGAAERLGRKDWRYIATGEGTSPDSLSSFFPYAGHVVMRDGWSEDAQWSFFDVGPYGIAHQHRDKLHLSVTAFGRDLLVDPGRFTYERGRWREYFRGSSAHNVILVDGRAQRRGELEVDAPVPDVAFASTPEFDYARGVFDDGFAMSRDAVVHRRAVMYVRGRYWVVVDRIVTDRPRFLEALWHYHPDCGVVYEGDQVESVDEGAGNLRIVPGDGSGWHLEVLEGRGAAPIQGWYSVDYGRKEAAPVASYSREIPGTTTFAWLLLPALGTVPPARLELTEVTDERVVARVSIEGQRAAELVIPVTSGTPAIR